MNNEEIPNNDNVFEKLDKEIKKEEQTDDFVSSLPDWDLPPLYEKVRRVNRE